MEQLRRQQLQRRRRQRFFVGGGTAAVVIIVVAVLAAVLSSGSKPKTAAPTPITKTWISRLPSALACDPRCRAIRPGFKRYGMVSEKTFPAARFEGSAKSNHAAVAATIAPFGTPRRRLVMTPASIATRTNSAE